MKLFLALWLGTLSAVFAVPAGTSLTLVSQAGFNVLTVTIDPQISGFNLSDTDTTTLTGILPASFNVDPNTGLTTELTLTNGRVYGTNMNFSRSIFLVGGYNMNLTNISAAVNTITPPGVVTASTGQFVASQHRFDVDQGNVTGSTSGLFGSNAINETFTPQNPASGNGQGTGIVVLVNTGDTGIYRNYTVTVTLPVAISDVLDAGGIPVKVTATGTIKATGTLQVARSEYLSWTVRQNHPGVAFLADPDGDGIPHGILWALGLGINDEARSHLPIADATQAGRFSLSLPSTGTAGTILVESSDNLTQWVPAVFAGNLPNPIPPGTSGTITMPPSIVPCRFLRLKVLEP